MFRMAINRLFEELFAEMLASRWRTGFDYRPRHVSLGTSRLGWRRPRSSLSILSFFICCTVYLHRFNMHLAWSPANPEQYRISSAPNIVGYRTHCDLSYLSQRKFLSEPLYCWNQKPEFRSLNLDGWGLSGLSSYRPARPNSPDGPVRP